MASASSFTKTAKTVILITNENSRFEVPRHIAEMSTLVKDMLEEDQSEAPEIPLLNVDDITMKQVLEYCNHHHDNPAESIKKPLTDKLENLISEFDKNCIAMSIDELFALVKTANYLHVQPLFELICAAIANMMRGKTAEEIRQLLHIENDLTPEEEAKIREENKWCEEN